MGLTPLDGFIMGSRCGGVDPSAITYLQEKEGWTPAETAEILNKKSGVLGISGISSDDRDVLAAAEAGNKRAALARSIQRYQIRKFIGAYVAAMDGVDAIVFTGGIGENTCDLREDVCKHLTYLGVKIDCEKNLELRKGKEANFDPGFKGPRFRSAHQRGAAYSQRHQGYCREALIWTAATLLYLTVYRRRSLSPGLR